MENETFLTVQKPRVAWLDVYKGLAMVAIVFYHVSEYLPVKMWLNTFHVPLFFFVSGMLFCAMPFGAFLKKRAASILIPYFSFAVLSYIYYILIECRFRSCRFSNLQLASGIITGDYDHLFFNIPLWFLPAFFVVQLFYNTLCLLLSKRRYGEWTCVGIGILLALLLRLLPIRLPAFWEIRRAVIHLPTFCLGRLFALCFGTDPKWKPKKLAVNIALSVAIGGISIFSAICIPSGKMLLDYCKTYIGLLAVMFLAWCIPNARLLSYIGRTSLVIMCLHGPIYRAIIGVFSILFSQDEDVLRTNFFYSAVITLLTFGICAVCYAFLHRFLPWMIGEKRTKGKQGR